VFVRYCDGASFSGRQDDPIDTPYEPLMPKVHSCGNFILEDVINELFTQNGALLSTATHVVVGGGSAGALAIYLHGHQIRDWLPDSMKLAAIPDAGFFPEWDEMGSTKVFSDTMKKVFTISQAQESLPDGCVQSPQHAGSEYRCFFAPNVARYIPVPFFVVNSKYDSFQIDKILGYDPDAAIIKDVEGYSTMLSILIQNAIQAQKDETGIIGSGRFTPSCSVHTMIQANKWYTAVNVEGVPVNEAVRLWIDQIFNGIPTDSTEWISNELFGCVPCCG